MDQQRSQLVSLPSAIIVAGALIAIAIIWVKKPVNIERTNDDPQNAATEINLRPVTSSDHILGNPKAEVKIVEYSDSACPFCRIFNPTMVKIMDEYGPTGRVAWVYRHFPLDEPDEQGNVLHKNAELEARAMECAASIGGNDGFWAYEKRLYEVTPSVTSQTPEGLDPKELPEIAKFAGINVGPFNECLESGRFKDKVEADYLDGIKAGVSGTPYSVIITPSGTKIPMTGAQPYQTLKSAIDALLQQ